MSTTERKPSERAVELNGSGWRDGTTVPKDGTTIVAVGRVMWSDDFSTCSEPFVAALRWFQDDSNYEGWHWDHSGLTVARALDDKVMVDWWMPLPYHQRKETKE